MMYTTTISSKGQVVIPQKIRQELRLSAHDRVTFKLHDSTLTLEKVPTVEEMAGFFYKKGRKPVTNEEMDQVIAKAMVKDHLQKEIG